MAVYKRPTAKKNNLYSNEQIDLPPKHPTKMLKDNHVEFNKRLHSDIWYTDEQPSCLTFSTEAERYLQPTDTFPGL